MTPTRRIAALGLAAAGVALPAGRALAQQRAPLELPDEDAPDTELATRESRNEHMLAPVSINGQGPFNFLLDTGANISCVSNRLMQRLSLTSGESAPVHTVVGVRQRPIVTLDHLQVGPRNRRNVRAPALPIKGPEVDGVLGVDWLKGQRLVLDFKGQTLEITRSRQDESKPGKVVVVPARRRKGQLTIVDADLSGRRISAIIDSGAQGTLCNGRLRDLVRASERRAGRDEAPRWVQMETLAGEQFTGESVFLPFLRLGGLHLGNVQVTYADMHVFDIWDLKDSPALVIGMDLLQQFEQVALDFGRSQVRFDFT
ncbi:MAG: aspartyl protease family protein [Phenylobacterium sp.]|uniref:retroviral-like aspartic protease family protein n=1 Tax=Phenylobacterium sp. TaxID=1871053 RepID=UPI001A3759F5|nr:retroviral-like aspartic protease family protein [Phenylobacterium sp.]MBL8556253.1 aspartyl protease family protein [Phenylobacterium sp.]